MTSTTVNNGQTVNNLDITSGSSLDVAAGGTANNTTIENGGFVSVEATSGGLAGIFGPKTGGVADGVIVHGGTLDLRGSNSHASNIVLNGGTIEIETTASVTGSLTFGPTTGTQSDLVVLGASDGNFKPTLTGFSASSALDDNAVPFAGATFKTAVSNGNTIATLSGNGVTNTFTFAGTPQLMIVPDNGDDSGPEAVIVTTNTTLSFSALPGEGQQASQASIGGGQHAQAFAQSGAVSALQEDHTSQPVMSFLSQPQVATPAGSSPIGLGISAATHTQAATGATAGTQAFSSIAHEMALPQNEGLAWSMLGALSQPQYHGAESAMAGFLSNPARLTGVEVPAAIGSGALQHVTTAAATPVLLHIG